MADAPPSTATSVWRCSDWSRAERVDPIGTAGDHRGYLIADVDLPWPDDIGDLSEVAAAVALLGGTGVRFQARVPAGPRRATLLAAPGPAGTGGARWSEVDVEGGPGGLEAAVEALLDGAGEQRRPDERELVVCTHGRRDRCCGTFGTRLAAQAEDPAAGLQAIRVRRTSHSGGHRFAPTAIMLPEATSWAFVDLSVLTRLVERSGPVADVVGHYRGCALLGPPTVQALDRAVLAEEGWEHLDRDRWGEELDDGRVALHVGGRTWRARVTSGRRVPKVPCGGSPDEARGADHELVVDGLEVDG